MLFLHGNRKFGQVVTPKFQAKCCAVVSSKLERPRLSIMDVSTSRALKSYTSNEVMSIFDNEFYINLKSDFTMNSLSRYQEDIKQGKCLFVNDGTELFASKSQRTKDRLVGGCSELLSDGSYGYQDYNTKFTLTGKVTMIMNITSEAYQNYKDRLFGLTFAERFLILHHLLTEQEKTDWVRKEEFSKTIKFPFKITTDDIETHVEIPRKYQNLITYLAREFSYSSLKTFIGCQDLIKATLKAHASLNKRNTVCEDDIKFVRMIQDYLTNPFSPYEGLVIRYKAQGFSIRDICKKIGKPNYGNQAEKIIHKAQLRGILELEQSPLQKGINNIGRR